MTLSRDDIVRGALCMWQPQDGPRVMVDTVLLSAFAHIRKGENVLELGSATGAVTLLLALRFPEAGRISGVEIQPDLVELAKRNAGENGLSGRVSYVCGDLRNIADFYPPETMDVVVTNPPYHEIGRNRRSAAESSATARQEVCCSLEDVLRCSKRLLRNKGRLYMVFLADRTAELFSALSGMRLEPKRIRFVHHRPGAFASVVLVEAVRAAGKGLFVEPPFFLYGENGEETEDMKNAYAPGDAGCR